MGESKANPRSNDYRGPAAPNYTVGFKVIHAPHSAWVERHKAEIEAGTAPECPPADMRIGVMLCLLEVVKSPLNMVPDQIMVRPCAVVFSESMEAFEANKKTPAELDAWVAAAAYQGILSEGVPLVVDGEAVPSAQPEAEAPASESTTEPIAVTP